MPFETIAEQYHEETKYHEDRMHRFQKQIDWNAQPLPYKTYISDTSIDLSPFLSSHNNPQGEGVTARRDATSALGSLSHLLYFTHGVTAMLQYANGQSLALRAAPTAGGLYPTEIYVVVRDTAPLHDGIYNFQAKGHALVPAWEGNVWNMFEKACFHHEALPHTHMLIVMTAVFERSAWRYQERAYRRILLDTGHILGNLMLYAPRQGFSPYLIGGGVDASLNNLLFLDGAIEGVLTVVALPKQAAIDRGAIRTPAAFASSKSMVRATGKSLQWQLHHASSILPGDPPQAPTVTGTMKESLASRYKHKTSLALSAAQMEWRGGEIEQTMIQRRSTRAFTGEALFADEFAQMMRFAYQENVPLFAPWLLETYVVMQKGIDVGSGVYYYEPAASVLRMLRAGDFKAQAWHFCLGQDLARDASAMVIHTAHLRRAMDVYGDRAYRYLHLDAGHIGQRLNLAAVKLGLGVSGIGGFYDDEVNALLGLSLDYIVVYITVLGRGQA